MPSVKAAQYADQATGRLQRISLILTNRCNFNCEYCISRPRPGTHKDLPTEDAMAAIDFAKGKGVTVRFTGGEPTLHKDFYKIVQHAIANGLPVEILTNGTFIPTDPEQFDKKMAAFLVKSSRFRRAKLPKIKFYISVDPVHFEMDPRLKDRLFLLANFIAKHKGILRAGADYLKINVRGNFHDKVYRTLMSERDLSSETIRAFGGMKKLQRWLGDALWDGFFEIQQPQSIIKVGGARDYRPHKYGAMGSRGNIRAFDIHKERVAGLEGTDISINPNGNAFASVYSAYENMFPTSRSPNSGKLHPRPYRFGLLGNVHQHGMPVVVGTLMQRVTRWNEFLRSPHMGGYYRTKDLRNRDYRRDMQTRYTKFLDERRRRK
jgi:organic radical activating enzyme